MALSIGSAATIVGFVVLLHSTIAVIQYRDLLKIQQQDFTALPTTLTLEVLIGTALAIAGAYILTGPLKPIRLPPKGRSMDIGSLRTDFISFNHRARAMPLDMKPLCHSSLM